MKQLRWESRTDACGRSCSPTIYVMLTKSEWDEMATRLEITKPYREQKYHLGCGWIDRTYEMAMLESKPTGVLRDNGYGPFQEYGNWVYLLEGHEKPMRHSVQETMNEYNS